MFFVPGLRSDILCLLRRANSFVIVDGRGFVLKKKGSITILYDIPV